MALVGVVDVRRRRAREPRPEAQRPHAAHAEQHLLLEAQLAAAAVEALGDGAAGVVVGVHVGVEEEQRHATDLGAPHGGVQLPAAGRSTVTKHGAPSSSRSSERAGRPGPGPGSPPLPAVAVEALAEVPGLVEQAHSHDRHADVGRRLEVVAGEDAEAAGVLRQGRRDTELRAEVGDGRRHPGRLLTAPVLVPAVLDEVAVEGLLGGGDPLHEQRVGREPLELVGGHGRQHRDRVLPHRLPPFGVDALEEVAQRRVPAPPQVHREVAECGDGCGQDGADAEAADGLHEGAS